MASQHSARFTWGTGPQTVFVAGGFNNWSDTATALEKQPDGSFAADVPMPWGEKQAFKYVVDGEWKVREDEAKEWDAAGNMNNVYTAPHAPAPSTTSAAPAGGEPTSSTGGAGAAATALPAASAPDTAPAAASETQTEPSSLLASSAPPAASSGAYTLGAVAGTTSAPLAATSVSATGAELAQKEKEPVAESTTAAVVPAAEPAAPTSATTTEPVPDQIEKTAATANVGDASTEGDKSLLEKAAEYGAGAAAALGAVVGGAAVAVEKATGIDLVGAQPLTVDEAEAKGIDVQSLETKQAETDAVAPASKPPPAAVDELDQKVQELKTDLPNGSKDPYANAPVPLEQTEKHEHDIPAQDETGDQHQHIPAPVITPVAPKDPSKDRTLNGSSVNSDTAGTKPIDSAPGVSAAAEKQKAEKNPALSGSTEAAATGVTTSAVPTTTETTAPAPAPKDIAPEPVLKDTPAIAPATTPAPATPVKSSTAADSVTSTPAKTPTGSTPKKKSGFMSKIKNAFHSPKEKK